MFEDQKPYIEEEKRKRQAMIYTKRVCRYQRRNQNL